MFSAASLMITCWKWTVPLSFGKEKQLCCKNSFYLFKEKQLVLQKLCFCLVEEWFYSKNIGGIIDDSLLEENRAIVIYLRNGEWTHEF